MTFIKTGIVYDDLFLLHEKYGHPERPDRVRAVWQELNDSLLINNLVLVPARDAVLEELLLAHPEEYIDYVKKASDLEIHLDPDTYTNQFSYAAAVKAVGSLVNLTTAVLENKVQNGFALVRPPGHHALAHRGMGFCIFSNVAIAALKALEYPDVNRLAIVDFDGHHGNGTQAIIGDHPDILFISSHSYPYYPGTGAINEIGNGKGKGTVINLPIPAATGDSGIQQIYEQIVGPSLQRFQPDFIFVSAGYDAHWRDPLVNLGFSLRGFSWLSEFLVQQAVEHCKGRIVFSLQGGYNLQVLSNGVQNSIKAMIGKGDFTDPLGLSPQLEPDIPQGLLTEIKKMHRL